MLLIGISGTNGSGKDTLANYLKEKNYEYYSLSDIIRDECDKEGLEKTRENLIKKGNELRKKFGNSVLAERTLKKLKQNQTQKAVIVSIRNPEELKLLKESGNLFMVFVDADIKLRYERTQKRKREDDNKITFETFKEQDERETKGTGKHTQQLNKIKEMSDYVIENNGTLQEFEEKIEELLDDIHEKNKTNRPSKDKYYMNIAKEVAQRSTCLWVKIGAIIVRDDSIVSTGYVGAPRGTVSSIERGYCLRRKLNIPSGQRYEMCRSVHAEQNAIINAARTGAKILGGTMYIYGAKRHKHKDKLIKAYPCFICKKMIINAGIKRVVITTEEGDLKSYEVEDWVREWREHDLIDDKEKYQTKYK